MGLTSGGFLAMWVIGGLTVVATAIRYLSRLTGRGWQPLLARVGLVVAAQVAAVAVVAVALNDHFGFYNSVSDIFGTNEGSIVVQGAAGEQDATSSVPPAAGSHPSVQVISGTVPAAVAKATGEILHVVVEGSASGLRSDAFVYLPPLYFATAYAKKRLPAVVVMPGYPSSASNLIMRMNYPWALERQIKAGRSRPMVLVMTNETVTPPRDTECTDVARGPKVATFLARDLTDAISARFRVDRPGHGWGLMGDSTGGFCAAKLAMLYPHRFTAAVSLSGYYHAIMDFTTGDLFGGSKKRQEANDPEWLLQHRPPPPVSVLVTTSLTEKQVLPDTRKFLSLVRAPMRASSIILPSGGHNFGAWGREMPACIDWLSSRLSSTVARVGRVHAPTNL